MKNQEFPKFIQNTSQGKDKLEGLSGERTAKAIENHISKIDESNNIKFPKIIGLEGKWGSGKSNVIAILKESINKKYYLFEYDAWGHQEDLQRRSFLETLTYDLINAENKKLLPKKCSRKNVNNEKEDWDEKLKNLLANKRETHTKTKPKISSGLSGALILFVLTPITSYIANSSDYSNFLKLIVALLPILIIFSIWSISSIVKGKLIWNELFEIYSNDKITDIVNETISENEPSVKEFKDWMKDLSADLSKPLIIVFDNMDRLSAEKVKVLWSSIHTFFSEENYDKIWVIIPYDKIHLANAFGDSNEKYELTNHFISKSFPINYRVSPLVMTDWKKLFNEYFDDAFGDTEDSVKPIIQRLFGVLKPNFTPRDIITFINEMVSLKKTWEDENIPLTSIAVFCLNKDEILKSPIENILSGSYLTPVYKIISNNEELQSHISALTYGININLAKQIPLKQYLSNSLKGEPNFDINEYADQKYFVAILNEEINDMEPNLIDKAVKCLSGLDKTKVDITKQWNTLVKIEIRQSIVELSFEDTYKSLLLNCDENMKIKYSKYLCEKFREHKQFKGHFYFEAMKGLDSFIKDNNWNIDINNFVENKSVSPEIFIEYLITAKEDYKKYKLSCDNKLLNEKLLQLLITDDNKLNFIKFIAKDDSYDFAHIETNIESLIISNKIPIQKLSEFIFTYQFISKEKPLKQQLSITQIQELTNSISDKTSEAYYDAISMSLAFQTFNVPFSEGLDIKVAERIENFKSYGELLILSKDWGNDLLRKSVKYMTENSLGENLTITNILPYFEEIKSVINIDEVSFLIELDKWGQESLITDNSLMTQVPNPSFYKYSSLTINKLTSQINSLAINKLSTIAVEDLYIHKSSPQYWLLCASYLISNNLIKSLPDNLIEFCKKLLGDISMGTFAIPNDSDAIGIIINSADKRALQPTIKDIGIEFCNKTRVITPSLFMYFSEYFNFTNKIKNRDNDISSVILKSVISNAEVLGYILGNSDNFIKIINNSEDDANDLKKEIVQIQLTNDSNELKIFANSIGINNPTDILEI